MRKSKVYDFSEEEFNSIIQNSYSFTECCKKIGLSQNGANGRKQIKKRCQELNISTEHFKLFGRNTSVNKRELDDILVENSTYTNNSALKARLIKEGLLEYKCAICNNEGEWQGAPLVLQLDHIDGDHTNHTLTNLRLLCPNCHSQTPTFCSRKRRAKSREDNSCKCVETIQHAPKE